jgi:hypothetical protein
LLNSDFHGSGTRSFACRSLSGRSVMCVSPPSVRDPGMMPSQALAVIETRPTAAYLRHDAAKADKAFGGVKHSFTGFTGIIPLPCLTCQSKLLTHLLYNSCTVRVQPSPFDNRLVYRIMGLPRKPGRLERGGGGRHPPRISLPPSFGQARYPHPTRHRRPGPRICRTAALAAWKGTAQ